jgi:hypothetical protein
MKPKLAIYGDSYAREASWPSERPFDDKLAEVWVHDESLRELYDVENHAVQGSDFVYSYKKFQDSHKRYDKVIFVATSPYRHHFYIEDTPYFISGPKMSDTQVEWMFTDLDETVRRHAPQYKKIVTSLNSHYLYTLQDCIYEAGQAKLIEEMQKIRPDMIVIFAFYNRYFKESDFHLSLVSDMENRSLSIDIMKYKDCRPAHMTIENNLVLLEYVKKRLAGHNTELSLDDFIKPRLIDRSKYYKKDT